MRVTSIAIDPRKWIDTLGLALRNSGAALWDLCKNPRLWIAVGASLVVHAAILLISVMPEKVPDVETDSPIIVGISDPTYPPTVPKVINDNSGSIPAPFKQVTNYAEISEPNASRAMIDPDIFETDPGGVHGLIRISTENQEPLESLLNKPTLILTPRNISASDSRYNPYSIPRVIEPPHRPEVIITNTTTTTKPVVPLTANNSSVEESGFAIEGDLSRDDIISAPLPAYPERFKSKGLSNVVVKIKFDVSSEGQVKPSMILLRSSGYSSWDSDVQDVLRRWRFKPSGDPSRTGIITFRFILQ
ncbi:TonB family protein [candidate division WOR-3 bacterium]|nr:TonB family protein [candidate division WOR-3 bacterium]